MCSVPRGQESPLLFFADGSATRLYTLLADLVSILIMTSSAIRLPVYLLASSRLRRQIRAAFPQRASHRPDF